MKICILLFFIVVLTIIPITLSRILKKSFKKTAAFLVFISIMLIITQSGIWLYEVSGLQAKHHPEIIKKHLDRKPGLFDKNIQFRGYSIIALSNIAEGLVNYGIENPDQKKEITRLLKRTILIAIHPKIPLYSNPVRPGVSGQNGLYLSHLNFILGAYQRFTGDTSYLSMNRSISTYLAETTLRDPHKHIRSYTKDPYKWPADQAVTLCSLYLFDKNNKTRISVEPVKQWLEFMRTKRTEPRTRLHYSEATKLIGYWKHPRGCALSWSVKYMSRFAPAEAEKIWRNYKKYFKNNYLAGAGFREYLPRTQKKSDMDSGPIILGNGAAASAFGLGASKGMGDLFTYYQLNNSLKLADAGIGILARTGNKKLQKVSRDLLATSIRFSAETTTAWY
ncbi:MAG: hypothetical protein GY754_39035 [bacterium]|nr:hypothetical protein [bacterium]